MEGSQVDNWTAFICTHLQRQFGGRSNARSSFATLWAGRPICSRPSDANVTVRRAGRNPPRPETLVRNFQHAPHCRAGRSIPLRTGFDYSVARRSKGPRPGNVIGNQAGARPSPPRCVDSLAGDSGLRRARIPSMPRVQSVAEWDAYARCAGRKRLTARCSAAKRPTGDRFRRGPNGSRQSTGGRATRFANSGMRRSPACGFPLCSTSQRNSRQRRFPSAWP